MALATHKSESVSFLLAQN